MSETAVFERVAAEIDLVRRKFPALRVGERLDWILIPDYPLPANWFNRPRASLLFVIPPGYPNTGPDDFFVDGDLRFLDGSMPPGCNAGSNSSSGSAPVHGDWSWFSWHPAAWRPAAAIEGGDNLTSFLRGVNLCLKGVEQT